MGLPKVAVPEYSLNLPSTGKEIKYRPFLVKEEKLLLIAMESEDEQQIITATRNVLQNCIFDKLDVDEMPIFDIEYIFLWLRGKAKGEKLELKYSCPKCESSLPVDLNLEDIKISYPEGHDSKVQLTDDVMSKAKAEVEAQLASEGKPVQIWDKIVPGKMDRFVSDNTTLDQEMCLLDQDFIKDEKKNVADYIATYGDVAVSTFKRVSLG